MITCEQEMHSFLWIVINDHARLCRYRATDILGYILLPCKPRFSQFLSEFLQI